MDATLNERVAEEIRVMLARKRITATELARKAGMTQRSISRRITGEKAIDMHDLERIADALGVDVYDLLPARDRRVNRASSPAAPRTMPAPAPRHPVAVGQTGTAVAVRTRTNGPRSSRPLWRHG